MATVAGADTAACAAAPSYRPVRRLTVASESGGFGTALATVGDRLLGGAPNLGTAGSTVAPAYLFDPATAEVTHDLAFDVGRDAWWQFSVSAVGANPVVGIAPGTESDGLGGRAMLFDGASGAPLRSFTDGAIVAGIGDDVVIGGPGGAVVRDAATGALVSTMTIPDPDRRGVLAMITIGRRLIALAAAAPVGVHLFDAPTGRQIGFVGTRHGDARHFGSALAVNGATLAVTEVPQVNVFDVGFGVYLGTIDPPPGLGAAFGTALAYAGGFLAVGAPSSGDAGAVHVFDAGGTLVTTLPADGEGAGFGRALAGLGRSIAVGVPTTDGGAVVIYAPCGDSIVDAPVEQCDDGNDDDADGCDRACRLDASGSEPCGDADGNGTTTLSDGVQILRAAAGLESVCSLARCDLDGNGTLSITDAVQALRVAAGLSTSCRS